MDTISKILNLLDARGMTQGELESAARLPQNRLSKWKAGVGEPTASQALAIARTLKVSVEQLIDESAERLEPDRSDDERELLRIAHRLGYDVAIRRLMLAPDVRYTEPSYGEITRQRTEKPPREGKRGDRNGA